MPSSDQKFLFESYLYVAEKANFHFRAAFYALPIKNVLDLESNMNLLT